MIPHSFVRRTPRAALNAVFCGALVMVLLSCTTSVPRQRVIAASMPPVGAMVRLVTGDAIPVVTLLPAGRSPHDFEPSASDVKRMQGAELYVYVGEDIDGWMRRSAQAVAGENAPILAMRTVAPEPGRARTWRGQGPPRARSRRGP